MGFWDVVILIAVGALIALAVMNIRKGKTGGCSGNCEACRKICHKREQ
ncbi:MAG: FeoB-associated Cys-rich membrane protein [Clostridia bacterium]|nr:FeoB-associated Cys-rich membrane protein [Clostridia bacterium]